MDLGGSFPFSEDNGVRGFPRLDFRTLWVPTTPVKHVPARQQTAEAEKELHWSSTLGIFSAAELPVVYIADPADGSYSGTAGISTNHHIHHLNAHDVYWQKQAYQDTTARLGQNFHGGNAACPFTGCCSGVTQVSSPVMQPSLQHHIQARMAVGTTKGMSFLSCPNPRTIICGSRTALLIQTNGATLAHHTLTNVRHDYEMDSRPVATMGSKQLIPAKLMWWMLH